MLFISFVHDINLNDSFFLFKIRIKEEENAITLIKFIYPI